MQRIKREAPTLWRDMLAIFQDIWDTRGASGDIPEYDVANLLQSQFLDQEVSDILSSYDDLLELPGVGSKLLIIQKIQSHFTLMHARTGTSVANAEAIRNTLSGAVAKHTAHRPKNTLKQYSKKQDEYYSWCVERQFDDGPLVSEGKLVLFLTDVVIPRGNKRAKREDGTPKPLSLQGVEAYAKAVIDMYKLQRTLEVNDKPHLRGKALRGLFDTLKRGETKSKRDEFVDRGLGTVLDGYNLEDMKCLTDHWLKQSTGQASRERVDFLLGHALLARGETRRFIQLPDMLTLSLPDEGSQPCTPLVIIMNRGKSNQHGRIEYGAAMRCKEAMLCPLNAVSMYLFWRWHIEPEPFPDLSDRKRWYNIQLLKGKDATKEISYNAQLKGLKRRSAAKLAELHGADENQIRRAGRWNSEKMEGCYLTTLPRKAMRALAGFPTKGGSYWLPRAKITPSEALRSMVYLDLENAESQLKNHPTKEIAGGAFVKMLQDLRVVFLQDSVILRRLYPSLRIWEDKLFSSAEYLAFEAQLIAALPSLEPPENNSFRTVAPQIARKMSDGFDSIHGKLDGMVAQLNELRKSTSFLQNKRLVLSIAADDMEAQSTPTTSTVALSRSLTTVIDVWNEYNNGLVGQISVAEADRVFGTKWRQNPTEARFYSRRRVFYDTIARLAHQTGITHDEAAARLEEERLKSGKSLNGFMLDGLKRFG
ncbi:Short-chain dehydrogenase, partial [Globisporangium splendens]